MPNAGGPQGSPGEGPRATKSSGGLTLRECARALGTYDSSARQALLRVVSDGLAVDVDGRYVLGSSRRVTLELERAGFALATGEVVAAACGASPAVELAALHPARRALFLVLDPAADAATLVRLREALARVPGLVVREHVPEEEGEWLLGAGERVHALEERDALGEHRPRLATVGQADEL